MGEPRTPYGVSGPRLNQSASSSTAGPSSKRRTLPAASRSRIALRSSGRMSAAHDVQLASLDGQAFGVLRRDDPQRQALDLGLDVGPARSCTRGLRASSIRSPGV